MLKNYEGPYSKKCQDHVPCSFAYKLVCVDDEFTKQIVVFRGENALINLLKRFLKNMSEKEGEHFESSNTRWI